MQIHTYEAFNDKYTVINPLNDTIIITPGESEIDGLSTDDIHIVNKYAETHPGCVWSVIIGTVDDTVDEEDIISEDDDIDEEIEIEESDEGDEDEDIDSEVYSIVPGIADLDVYCYLITENPWDEDEDVRYVLDI
mgnify:CR=1 FL=1